MSFKKNILSNYCYHFYSIVISIVIIPFYLHYLGAAAFGLISLYVVLQTWLSLLNMGLIPALSREVTYCRDQTDGFFKIKKLLRSLEIIFLFVNLLIMLVVLASNHWIVHHWLRVEDITHAEVMQCIVIMGIIICFRLFADLYRAGITGMEQQVWLNGVNIILTTLRYGGGYVLLRWITRIPTHFFEYQLLIAVLEPILLGIKFYKMTPLPSNYLLKFAISWTSIRNVLPFASGLFYTTILWIVVSQSDKLVLSHILLLSTYGYLALVMIISGGILQFTMPIHIALLPRMTHLISQGKKKEMLRLYRQATQMVVVILFPLIGIIAIFSTSAIFIWTGNKIAATWAGPILFWYVLGNAFFVVSAFQFYLQFALGHLKLQIISDTLFTLISLPLIVFAAYHYGAQGTAITWFLTRGVMFFIWSPIVHHRYAPGMHQQWLLKDIFPIFTAALVTLLLIKSIPIHFELINRGEGFIILTGLTFFVLVVSALASSVCRDFFTTFIQGKKD